MTLVSRIKELAKENNLNLKLLEESAGFGNGTIRRWDNSPPAADKLLKVANMLNTSCEFLLTGKEQTQSIRNSIWKFFPYFINFQEMLN